MSRTIAYVGNAESQSISVLGLEDDGALTPIATVAIPGPEKPGSSTPMAFSPDNRFLFVGLRNEPFSIATFAVDPAGALSYVGSGPAPEQMAYISVDRTGRYLFAASYQGNKVWVSPIRTNGVIGEAQHIVVTKPSAHCIIVDRSNRHVLHTSLGGDVIYQQLFDPVSGTLAPNVPPTVSVRAKAGPRHIVLSPEETFAYLMNELDGSIYVFDYDGMSGRLGREVQIISALPKDFAGTPSAADIHLTPNGKFLYTSERGSNTLAAFAVDGRSGKLNPIATYPTETQPRGFNIDPSGRYLLAVGQLSHRLTSYAIDQKTGALTPLGQFVPGRNPNWIEFLVVSA